MMPEGVLSTIVVMMFTVSLLFFRKQQGQTPALEIWSSKEQCLISEGRYAATCLPRADTARIERKSPAGHVSIPACALPFSMKGALF